MSNSEIKLDACPCCGGEARAQFEVYGTWVRVMDAESRADLDKFRAMYEQQKAGG